MVRTSCSQLSAKDGTTFFGSDSNPFDDLSCGNQEEELEKCSNGGFINNNGSLNSLFDNDTDNVGLIDQTMDSSKLVPADVLSSGPLNIIRTCSSVDDNPIVPTEEQEAGTLFYDEPPHFPSFDIPFLSCDLIQSGNDCTQQEYSPLGIRQAMMPTMDCFTPFRLWDTSQNDSPEDALKITAKTFTFTPSILKKRNRDLVSPISEQRIEKKLESDMNQVPFSSLVRIFSRLDIKLDKNGNKKAPLLSPSSKQEAKSRNSTTNKEHLDSALKVGKEEGGDGTVDNINSKQVFDSNDSTAKIKQGTGSIEAKSEGDYNVGTQNVQQLSRILAEHNINDLLFFSHDRCGIKLDGSLGQSSRTHGNQFSRRLETTSNRGALSESSFGNPCSSSIVSSSTISRKEDESQLVAAISAQSAPESNPHEIIVRSSCNDAGVENLSIFGETPSKRSIESPSAWKSPWFINSFLPGPRVDTDITIEDIGYFMSPGDIGYDAIGLMKQLGEQNEAAFADAQEVLGDETPETILKEGSSKNRKPEQ